MADISELYQQLILDHNQNPRNYGALEGATNQAEGFNPLCGDQVVIQLIIQDGMIQDLKFQGQGCAISKASASVMTTLIKGKTLAEAEKYFQEFHTMLTTDQKLPEELGKMAVFSGVREFPLRVKCATLPWHTLQGALEKKGTISTE